MSLSSDLAKMARDNGIETRKLANNSVSTDKLFQLNQGEFIGRDNLQSGTGNVAASQSYPDISLTSALSAPFNATTAWRSLSAYINQVDNTNTVSPSSVYCENFGSAPGTNATIGACLAPNGKIYFIPHSASTVGYLINPNNNQLGTYNLLAYTSSAAAIANTGVLAPNGFIYLVPATVGYAAYINPQNDTLRTFGLNYGTTTSNKWYGGVLAPNGKIYCAPHNASTMLIIDPSNDTTTTLANYPGTGTWNGSQKFSGAVLSPNGQVYFSGLTVNILAKINPNDNTVTTFSIKGSNGGMTLAPNGKIYAIPYDATNFSVIDPSNDTITTFATCVGSNMYEGGVLAPNGKIYCLSLLATIGRIIDPSNNTVTTITGGGFIGGSGNYTGGVLAPNGKIYFAPYDATSFLCLNVPSNNNFNQNVCLSPFFNKY